MPAIGSPQVTSLRRLTILPAAVLVVVLLTAVLHGQSAPGQQQSTSLASSRQQSAPAEPARQQSTSPAPNSESQRTSSQPAAPAQSPPAQPADTPGNPQAPATGVQGQSQQPPPGAAEASEQPESQAPITKAQAKELFRSVDEILDFVSHDTGLPIEHKVKRNLITRQSVEKYLQKRMKDDKDEKRLEQSRLVLLKFGLLPPGYDLHGEFLRLLAEQVAAYYDPKTQSVNLLDWVQPDVQKPILAHELTHALQDQKVAIEKWGLAGAKGDSALPDQQEYSVEESQAARQCVTEGQAMVVLFDYMLAPLGKNILTAPEMVAQMRGGMADNKDSPVFAQAPMFLKESLLMPYTFGLDFVRTVLANRGKDAAFGGILENPPADTRQIMQPETYLLHQVVAPLAIPDFNGMVAPNYQRFDFGGMGAFDVYLLAKQYGAPDPQNYYPHWRGGYYFAAHAKTAPQDQIAMLYFSRWDSPEAARDFAKLWVEYLPKRYPKAALRDPSPALKQTRSLWAFDTDEGKAIIEEQGNDLLIMEGYDDAVLQKARDVYFYGMSLPGQPAKAKN